MKPVVNGHQMKILGILKKRIKLEQSVPHPLQALRAVFLLTQSHLNNSSEINKYIQPSLLLFFFLNEMPIFVSWLPVQYQSILQPDWIL